MRYYLDCEFDGFGGPLISLALVRADDRKAIYLVYQNHAKEAWVQENVLPILYDVPHNVSPQHVDRDAGARLLHLFFESDPNPIVISDWPADLAYFNDALLLSEPGKMVPIPTVTTAFRRVDAYPTDLPGAVQHNAYWDAQALRHLLEP